MSRDFEGTPNRDFKPSPNRDRIGRGGTEPPVGGVYQALVEWRTSYEGDTIFDEFESVIALLAGNVLPTSPGVKYYNFSGGGLVEISSFENADPPSAYISSGDRGAWLNGRRVNLSPTNRYTRLRAARTKVVFDLENAALGIVRPICVFDMTADRNTSTSPFANYNHVVSPPDCAPMSGSGRIMDFKIDMLPPHPTGELVSKIITPDFFNPEQTIQVRREFAFKNDLGVVEKAVNYLPFAPPACCNLS